MRDNKTVTLSFLVLGLAVGTASAQVQQDVPESNLISKAVKAVGYRVGGGSTKVDLKGTELMSLASGEAKVDARQGKTNIEVAVKNLEPPSKFGAEFLTYVLWVVTPDGRSGNTGEILIDKDGEGKLGATTPAQTFSMIVTAEPYFAVRVPSEVVILENDTRKSTKGQIFPINDFKLMKRAQYEKLGNPLAMTPDLERVPLQMYEARNAVDIAKSRSADKEAAAAKAKAEAEAKAQEEARRQAELAEAKQAQMKAEADAAATKAKAEADALKAKEEAARAEAERAQKAAAELRAQLLDQFNRVLETRDTPRGLVVNMGDVLFDFGKYDLRPEAREKLAKLSGIILAHPGLDLAVEGHTDNVGSDEVNQKLSEKRAETVRAYLVQQGLADGNVTAQGFGKTSPVVDNSTPEGRQKNRRVEIVVSGEVIGVRIGK